MYEIQLKPLVNSLKKECFGNNQVILYEISIRNKAGDFIDITKEQQEKIFESLGRLFLDNDFFSLLAILSEFNIFLFGVIVDCII